MDCTGVASHLVAYHLGSIEGEERDAIDAHLLSCTACLKTYLALKRAADARPADRPSPEARARLRAEVARTFASSKEENVVPLFRRRIPLYQGLAFAAVAAAIAFAAPSLFHRFSHDVGDGAPEVDTSRPRAESLQIY
jgi:anti-sigma factor RsiW